jgi:hypothetical protein
MITAKLIRSILDYDSATGVFTWKVSKCGKEGQQAGRIDNNGYIRIEIGSVEYNGKRYLAHRLAMLWMTGHFPKGPVDHINRNRSDNSWSNLRVVDASGNQWNRGMDCRNTSGFFGVFQDKRRPGKWRAAIRKHGKVTYLGSFDSPILARAAREEAERVRNIGI